MAASSSSVISMACLKAWVSEVPRGRGSKLRFSFISTMERVWGGSEELWSQAAERLVEGGIRVSASVCQSLSLHPRVVRLRERGVDLHVRPQSYPAWRRAAHKVSGHCRPLHVRAFERFLKDREPGLVVINNGGVVPPIELPELCVELDLPFVSIACANGDNWWPEDAWPSAIARRFPWLFGATSSQGQTGVWPRSSLELLC